MYRYSKVSWSRWCTILLVATSLALSVFIIWRNAPVFAANCGTVQNATKGAVNCSVSISAVIRPRPLILTNDVAVSVTGKPFTRAGSNVVALFTFTSLVKDHRGVGFGWVLAAASAGITGGGRTLPLRFTSLDGTSSCANGTCAAATFIPITLTATDTRFLTISSGTHTTSVDGDYSNKIDGSFTIPTGTSPGTYTGTISITLLNTF